MDYMALMHNLDIENLGTNYPGQVECDIRPWKSTLKIRLMDYYVGVIINSANGHVKLIQLVPQHLLRFVFRLPDITDRVDYFDDFNLCVHNLY